MHLPWVDFTYRLKNRSASSQCYFKKLSTEEKFHSYRQIDGVKLQRTFVKFVTVNTNLK